MYLLIWTSSKIELAESSMYIYKKNATKSEINLKNQTQQE